MRIGSGNARLLSYLNPAKKIGPVRSEFYTSSPVRSEEYTQPIRSDDTCYSSLVFTPFDPNLNVDTLDSFAAGNLSGKHYFVADSMIEDLILPLSNRGSALGHNFMLTQMTGNASCGTIDLQMASNGVMVIRANVYINVSSFW